MRRILIGLVALIIMGTAAHATTTLAAGALFGGSSQNVVFCYLFNAGTTAVPASGAKIIQQNSGPVTLASNNCTGMLAAGAICASMRVFQMVSRSEAA